MTDEEAVRAAWESEQDFDKAFDAYLYSKCVGYPDCDGDLLGERHESSCPSYIQPGLEWSVKRAFTDERRKQIAEVEEEIRLVDIEYEATFDSHTINNAWLRISARLQAALAELKRGMKGIQ